MYFAPVSEQFKQMARQDFEQLYRSGLVRDAWSTVTGSHNNLLRLEEVKRGKQVGARNSAGIQTVDIKSIAGSESRARDFDSNWRPLKRSNQERWTNISVAQMNGVPLPAIDLIKVGQAYFVRDGHHRISVARHNGQLEMEANVTEWHMAEENENLDSAASKNQDKESATNSLGQVTIAGVNKLTAAIESWQAGINLRPLRLFNRSEKPYNSGSAA